MVILCCVIQIIHYYSTIVQCVEEDVVVLLNAVKLPSSACHQQLSSSVLNVFFQQDVIDD